MRYQSEFIGEVNRLTAAVTGNDRIWLQARAANAARQMKRFDEAERLLRQAEKDLGGVAEKRGWDIYLAKLHDVLLRRDASIEPLDMIPEQQVTFSCMRQQPATAFDRAVCAKPDVAARIAEMHKSPP